MELHHHIKKHLKPRNLGLFLIGIIVLIVVFHSVGLEEIWTLTKSVSLFYLLLFIVVKTVGHLLWNFKWKVLIDELVRIKFTKLLPVFFTGLFVNNITPGPTVGGEAVKSYYLSKIINKRTSTCFATAVMDSAIQLLLFIVFSIFSIIYVFIFIDVPSVIVFLEAFLIIVAICIVFFVYMYKHRRGGVDMLLDKFFEWIYGSRFLAFLRKRFKVYRDFKHFLIEQYESFSETLKELWKDKQQLFLVSIIGFGVQIFAYLRTYFLFLGLDYEISFIQLIVVLTISTLIGYLLFLPGGTGAVEVCMIALFVAIGIEPGVAAAVTLLDRAIFYLYTYGIGFSSLVYLNYRYIK